MFYSKIKYVPGRVWPVISSMMAGAAAGGGLSLWVDVGGAGNLLVVILTVAFGLLVSLTTVCGEPVDPKPKARPEDPNQLKFDGFDRMAN